MVMGHVLSLADNIELDLHFSFPQREREKKKPPGFELVALHLDGFESYSDMKKKKTSSQRMRFLFLVDDIGLEPMTFRTSSRVIDKRKSVF